MWAATEPRATLYEPSGLKALGTLVAGPLWHAADGSSAPGTLVGSADVTLGGLPWQLYAATGSGPGVLARATYVQQLSTAGGGAPAPALCNVRTAGTTAAVAFTADYDFWH